MTERNENYLKRTHSQCVDTLAPDKAESSKGRPRPLDIDRIANADDDRDGNESGIQLFDGGVPISGRDTSDASIDCTEDDFLPAISTVKGKEPKHKPSKRWAFTINNYTPTDEERIQTFSKKAKVYIIYGYEICPKTGTPHLQGYCHGKSDISHKIALEIFKVIFYCRKNGLANTRYCMKQKSKDPSKDPNYIELNINLKPQCCIEAGKKGGEMEQNEWMGIKEMCKTKTYWEIVERQPEMAIKYSKVLQEWCEYFKNEDIKKGYFEDFLIDEDHPWDRGFQLFLIEYIEAQLNVPDKRSIAWVYDHVGKIGKTQFITHLMLKYPNIVQRLEPADHTNFTYLVEQDKKIFLIDCQRDGFNNLPYTAIESLKNGIVQSTKYRPTLKYIRRPIVIVFANQIPLSDKMSQDKFVIYNAQTSQII